MIAQFGEKRFSVSRNKVYTFSGFTYSSKLNTESKDASGKKSTTSIKGVGLDQIKLVISLYQWLGVDPRSEIKSWWNIKDSAVAHPFLLGAKAVGVNKYLLTECSVGKTEIDKSGNMTTAELSLSFTEYLPAGVQVAAGKGTNKRAAGLTAANVYKASQPTTDDKEAMKRKNMGMGGW